MLSDYPARVPLLVRDTLKKAFPSQEQCRDYDDLVLRVQSLLIEQDEKDSHITGLSFNGQGEDLLAAIEQAQKIKEEREAAEKQRQLEEEEKRRKEEERKEKERVEERQRQEEIAWAKAEAARIKAGWDIVDGIVKKCRLNDQRLVVPDEVVEFGPSCFDQKVDFSTVKVLVLPKSLKAFDITFDISERFRGLEKIEIDKANTSFESIDGVLYTRGLETLICCPAKPNWGTVTLPSETKVIAEHAFDNVELKEVKTSAPLTVLPNAFLRCRFDHITIPSQSKIESGAFTASKGKTLLIESMCKVASSAFSGAEFGWLFIKERKPLLGLPPNWSRDALKNYFSVKPSWI